MTKRMKFDRFAQERALIRAKVQPEVDAAWAEVEARQAEGDRERNAQVEVHRERERQLAARRAEREAADEAAWQKLLTGEPESALIENSGQESHRPGGFPENKEGQMPTLTKKQIAAASKSKSNGKAPKAAKVAKPKVEKAKTFCLFTGAPTNGTNFAGLGTDAKMKSSLINTVLKDPKATHFVYDHSTGEKLTKPAIEILKGLGWVPMLEKARAARKAKIEAANEKSAAKVAKQPNKSAK